MKIFRNLSTVPPGAVRNGCVTIGNFDGVHRGHRALLGQTRDAASSANGAACALTFWPHPRAVLSQNAQSATTYFRIPPNQVVELGAQVEL